MIEKDEGEALYLDPEAGPFFGPQEYVGPGNPDYVSSHPSTVAMIGLMYPWYRFMKAPKKPPEPHFRWIEERIADAVCHASATVVSTLMRLDRPHPIKNAVGDALGHAAILLAKGSCKLASLRTRLKGTDAHNQN